MRTCKPFTERGRHKTKFWSQKELGVLVKPKSSLQLGKRVGGGRTGNEGEQKGRSREALDAIRGLDLMKNSEKASEVLMFASDKI